MDEGSVEPDLTRFAREHPWRLGVVTGVLGGLLAAVVTWNVVVGAVVGVAFGLANSLVWRSGLGPRWRERIVRRFPARD